MEGGNATARTRDARDRLRRSTCSVIKDVADVAFSGVFNKVFFSKLLLGTRIDVLEFAGSMFPEFLISELIQSLFVCGEELIVVFLVLGKLLLVSLFSILSHLVHSCSK